MKNSKFKILIGIIGAIIIGLFFLLKIYNEPQINVRNKKADLVLNAKHILQEYQRDEISANKKYTDQILEIKGRIYDISTLNGTSIITLKNHDSNASIICHLLPEENIKVLHIKKGQNVTIKGVCTGFLMDVIMVRCILAN